MRKLRILYAGSPLASSLVLKKLLALSAEHGYEICGVLTNPPSTRGRHKELIPTEVARAAVEAGLPVLAFDHVKQEARDAAVPLSCDLLVTFDYGRIFGPKFLALFPLGGINLHPSALPRYRGCTPVPAALLAGDSSLGVAVQKIALKTDEGDILASDEIPLTGVETTLSLMDGDGMQSPVTDRGSALLDSVLCRIVQAAEQDATSGGAGAFARPAGTPQTGEASYTPFINKEDGRIDWTRPAAEIDRKIRAYTPWPLCFTTSNGVQLIIVKAKVGEDCTSEAPGTVLPYRKAVGIEIACGDGRIIVASELQWQSKKAMDYKSFMNGARNFIGSSLA
ncbi:MAG: methionyl-tRNA formyltransferase [Treponema sp.]|nr:methionyl-tRNA formyltransferase [Treponema sp.]